MLSYSGRTKVVVGQEKLYLSPNEASLELKIVFALGYHRSPYSPAEKATFDNFPPVTSSGSSRTELDNCVKAVKVDNKGLQQESVETTTLRQPL